MVCMNKKSEQGKNTIMRNKQKQIFEVPVWYPSTRATRFALRSDHARDTNENFETRAAALFAEERGVETSELTTTMNSVPVLLFYYKRKGRFPFAESERTD